jgi:hypothetical protein
VITFGALLCGLTLAALTGTVTGLTLALRADRKDWNYA